MRKALIVIGEGPNQIYGKWLKQLVPILVEAMERHGHMQLASKVRRGQPPINPAIIGRAMREMRGRSGG
ncbi:hypothetical protein [Limobrevibacterium gyesilva]|uniref:Uncharacterized protein n=1 Tax=Limobrevibacterium gyesilva TaxID=2991712 RepID=A0AA41YLL6_9PROT|nr:hypothetical protein [Limobrevibacterium gyesilva]MCW3474701.1 hypothetical protein [Limobrevibacterium gyesilva]